MIISLYRHTAKKQPLFLRLALPGYDFPGGMEKTHPVNRAKPVTHQTIQGLIGKAA